MLFYLVGCASVWSHPVCDMLCRLSRSWHSLARKAGDARCSLPCLRTLTQKGRRSGKRQGNPTRTSEKWKKVTENEEMANNGHRKARAQEAQHVRSSTLTKVEERERRQATAAAHSDIRSQKPGWHKPSGKETRPPCFSYEKGRYFLRQELRQLASTVQPLSQKRTMQIRYEFSLRPHR